MISPPAISRLAKVLGISLALWVLFVLGLALEAFAANIGPVLPVSTEGGNQQNPTVVALPDHGFWFVAWEDWQNPLDADIYGAFVRMKEAADPTDKDSCLARGYVWNNGRCYEKAEICAGPFLITEKNGKPRAGNQITPAAAYSPDDQVILVLWKDEGTWDTAHAWLHLAYRFLTVPDNCTTPTFGGTYWVPYDPVFDCQACRGTCSCRRNYSYAEICQMANHYWWSDNQTCWQEIIAADNSTDCNNQGGTWDNNTDTCYKTQLQELAVCNELHFEWDTSQNTCYQTQSVPFLAPDKCQETNFYTESIVYPAYPECNAGRICGEDGNATSLGKCHDLGPGWFSTADDNGTSPTPIGWERLLARERPTVIYNPKDKAFWLGWVEVRSQRNRLRFLSCLTSDWITGEGIFPGYAKCRYSAAGCSWKEVDILRNHAGWGEHGARLLEVSSTDNGYQAVYEYFTEIDQVSLAPDLRNGGIYFSFSGRRHQGTIQVNCNQQTDSFTEQETPQGHSVYGILERQMHQTGIHAIELSTNTPAYHPALEYDPVTGRFLVVWEDSRDTGVNAPKIYGQLIEGISGGFYMGNFCLSPETQNDQDIKQSAPTVEWDPVNQRFFVAWQDNRAGTISVENIDIYGQRVDAEGSLRGNNLLVSATENGEPTAGNQLSPAIAYDPKTGIYLAVWKDARNYEQTGSDIYAQAFGVDQPQLTLLDGQGHPLHRWVLDFGTVNVGERTSLRFYLKNTGDAALRLCEFSALKSPFSYAMVSPVLVDGDKSSCLTLQPGMQTEVMVEFAPTEEGSFSAHIKITSDAGEHTLLLQGGVRPVISADRTNFDFGEVLAGNTRALSFTFINHLKEDVSVGSIMGPNPPFSLKGVAQGTIIPGGGSVSGQVLFAPENPGSFNDTIIFTFSKGGSLTFNLKGVGKESPVIFSPSRLDFGPLKVGKQKTLSLTIINQGDKDLLCTNIRGISAPFYLEEVAFPFVIPAGGSKTLKVTFSPGEKRTYEEELTFSFRLGSSSFEVNYYLSGKASALPACIYNGLPTRTSLAEGQSPVWLLLVSGDEDLILSRFQEPGILQLIPLVREPGRYFYALIPPADLEPYTYRDRISLLFAGARRPVKAETELILSGPPLGWEGCVPELDLKVNGKRAIFLKRMALPPEVKIAFRLNWPCAPSGAEEAQASLSYFYQNVTLAPPFNYEKEIKVPRKVLLGLDPGTYVLRLSLVAADGTEFYAEAMVIIDTPSEGCEIRDLGE